MTPALSKSHHELMLNGVNYENNSMDYTKTLVNAQINPTERQTYQMYEHWR